MCTVKKHLKAETMRQDVDIGLAKFLSQEMTENSKRSELTTLLEEVDELEAEVLVHTVGPASLVLVTS